MRSLNIAIPLLLVALSANADTTFTSTAYLCSVPVPGVLCTNGAGQALLKGNVHIARVLGSDPRVTSRLQAGMDLVYKSDGTATFSGPAYAEVGNWDSFGTNFTPIGGVWNLNYRGTVLGDGSSHYTMTGYGMGGSIEGLRIFITATKAGSDTAIPYLSSGTIRPAPLDLRVVVDNFDNNLFSWPNYGAGAGTFSPIEKNQQLTIQGHWPSQTVTITDYTAWANPQHPWSVQPGQTLEVRVDLVSLGATATAAVLALYHQTGQAYVFAVSPNWLWIGKQNLPENVCYAIDPGATRTTNIVLALALTPVGQNVVLMGRVFDKDTGAVLRQIHATDTPAADPFLTPGEVSQLAGLPALQDIAPDPVMPPWTSGLVPLLGVFQNTDGTLAAAEATFDNLEFRTFEVPPVGIERAVRLTWPSTGMNFQVESSPAANGPWVQCADELFPGMEQMTVPASGSSGFFRLRQMP